MTVLYEDNHLIIVNKAPGEIVQGDKTGDTPLAETVKAYLKEKYAKPGNVFLGVAHRLDRPVSGVVVFAKTSKALSRLCELFRNGNVRKTYHALLPTADLRQPLPDEVTRLEHRPTPRAPSRPCWIAAASDKANATPWRRSTCTQDATTRYVASWPPPTRPSRET